MRSVQRAEHDVRRTRIQIEPELSPDRLRRPDRGGMSESGSTVMSTVTTVELPV
jgi:hypothetical protein